MSIELKPCPFCGSDSITNHDTLIGYSVGCDKCGAVAAHCATKAESISAWNTRTAIQQAEARTDVRCEGCGYMTHHREHLGCVRAAKQYTHHAPGVPDGYVLVPIVPTREMTYAAMVTADSEWCYHVGHDDAKKLWASMLTAALAQKGQP